MDSFDAIQAMRTLLAEMRRTRYVPDEARDRGRPGQLGFDYGYHQALYEVEAKLYLAFPGGHYVPVHAVAAATEPPHEP